MWAGPLHGRLQRAHFLSFKKERIAAFTAQHAGGEIWLGQASAGAIEKHSQRQWDEGDFLERRIKNANQKRSIKSKREPPPTLCSSPFLRSLGGSRRPPAGILPLPYSIRTTSIAFAAWDSSSVAPGLPWIGCAPGYEATMVKGLPQAASFKWLSTMSTSTCSQQHAKEGGCMLRPNLHKKDKVGLQSYKYPVDTAYASAKPQSQSRMQNKKYGFHLASNLACISKRMLLLGDASLHAGGKALSQIQQSTAFAQRWCRSSWIEVTAHTLDGTLHTLL